MKKLLVIIMSLMMSVCLIGARPVSAASPVLVNLTKNKVNITNSSYDLNNDGSKDTIKITTKTDDWKIESIKLTINGKTVFTRSNTWLNGFYVYYLKYNASHQYLILADDHDNGISEFAKIYRFDGQKLNEVKNLAAAGDYALYSVKFKATKSTFVSKYRYNSKMAGMIYVTTTYKYKSGKFTLKSNKITRVGTKKGRHYLTSKANIQVYKSASTSKPKFKIKKGQKVYFKSIVIKSGKAWFKIKAGGKTGYILEKGGLDSNLNPKWFKGGWLCA